jgi:hypothetical protein
MMAHTRRVESDIAAVFQPSRAYADAFIGHAVDVAHDR